MVFIEIYYASQLWKMRKSSNTNEEKMGLCLGRDEGIFVKTMFEFKESSAKVLHKLKNHVRGVISASLTSCLTIC